MDCVELGNLVDSAALQSAHRDYRPGISSCDEGVTTFDTQNSRVLHGAEIKAGSVEPTVQVDSKGRIYGGTVPAPAARPVATYSVRI